MATLTAHSGNPRPVISVGKWLSALAGIAITCILIVFTCMLPNAYMQSGYPELRALIIPRFVLVASTAGCGWLTGWLVYSKLGSRPRFSSYVAGVFATLIFVVATVSPLYSTSPILIRAPFFAKWAQQWDQRDQQIRYAASYNQGSLQVVELDHIIPRVAELQLGGWYTQCANQYYGIQILPQLPVSDQDISP
jgi:hypothetical protein